MNCPEKRHVSHKANTQNVCYLDSIMDETDREVMNLTDRAFKSLCIGDEAIYNDSGLSPSPVSCHKPFAEEVPKKTQESLAMTVKKQGANPLNGVNNTTWQINKNSYHQMSSLFKAFVAGKNGDGNKMTNGDKSALLSIQKELSEFSSDCQCKAADFSQAKNHIKSSETDKKSSKDISTQSGKTSKNKQSKSSKLRKLNSKNLFLHSEFSPFQSWGDLNKFGCGIRNMEIFTNNGTPEWYDSPLYKELATSHISESIHSTMCQITSHPGPQNETKLVSPQYNSQAVKTAPLKSEKTLENQSLPDINGKNPQQGLLTSAGYEQRCQSEGNPCAPWRKHRSRAKSAVPASLPIMNSPGLEIPNPAQDIAQQNKKEVRTMEEQTSSSSTPFSILQLLTPVIPSRHGTGNSEILQSILSPTTLDSLTGTEMRPSPEIKREGYKSIASSLLFNLKDNRKRVKTMYSPPKFKVLESVDQNKHSLTEQVDKNALELPEFTDPKTASPIRQKAHVSQMSPLLETTDLHSSSPDGQINGGLPDDYLALSLLHAGSKSNRSPVVKPSYPSLHLYRKSSPVEFDTKHLQALEVPDSVSITDKSGKQVQNNINMQETNSDNTKTKNALKTQTGTNIRAEKRQAGSTHAVTLKEKQTLTVPKRYVTREDALTHSKSTDKLEKRSAIENKPKSKHSFSSKQNNYIKSQRNMRADGNEDCEQNKESKNSVEWGSESNINEELKQAKPLRKILQNDATSMKENTVSINNGLTTSPDKDVAKNDMFSMKGNTSAKRALFGSKGQMSNGTVLPPKKEKIMKVMDKYELAKVALKEVIAEREQRKKQALSSSDTDNTEGWKRHVAGQDSVLKGEYMQVNMLGSIQSGTSEGVMKSKKGQRDIADLKSSQIIQSMPDRETKHDENHVTEIKLARPPKQDGAFEHHQQGDVHIKHTETSVSQNQRDKDNKSSDKVDHFEKDQVAKYVSLEESSESANDNKMLTRQGLELAFEKKSTSSKPEVPPRRGRTNSQCDDIFPDEERQEDVTGRRERGPVRGHVSALKEKFDRDQGESPAKNDQIKQVANIPKVTVDAHEGEKNIQENMGINSGNRENKNIYQDNEDSKSSVIENTQNIRTAKNNETAKTVDRKENENESNCQVLMEPGDNRNKSDSHSESSVKVLSSDLCRKSGEENGEKDIKVDKETPTISESPQIEKATLDSATLYDIGEQSNSSVNHQHLDRGNHLNASKESYFLPKTEDSLPENQDLPSQTRKYQEDLEHICFFSNPESCTSLQSVVVSLPSDVEKGEWVRCLIESTSSSTPTCQSNICSPTMEKPSLFKVKDNTFSASSVTKTVRPILHKTVSDVTQLWSPRESLSGSERGEGDLDLFKDCVEVQSPTIVSPPLPSTTIGSPSTNQPPIHSLSPIASQLTMDREKKGQLDGLTVPEEDEWRSAVSSVTEEIETSETSAGDTVEELASNTAPTEDVEGSKAPSERSGSVSSVTELQSLSKPPAVPMKTEKAMRRAMQLTAKRIQKAEAKSKLERQSRSTEKSVKHKTERRHHSTDKVLSCTSEQRAHSVDRSSGSLNTGDLSNGTALKTHRNEKHTRQHKNQERHNTGDLSCEKVLKTHRSEKHPSQHKNQDSHKKETSRKEQQESHDGDTYKFKTESKCEDRLRHNDLIQIRNVNAQCERIGRKSQKYLPEKLDRRTHSLDRFLGDKHEHNLFNTVSGMNTETSHILSTAGRAPLRQNSVEHTYASTATNIVTQSFPVTQRKLLQDLDSGRYFVVDMPVQVKTKTFFDPETGSYVQLPVQSSETSLAQAQSMEVVAAPSLVLYHGFVPLPVSSLPAQKSVVKVGSIATPAELEVYESNEMEKHQKLSLEAEAYIETIHEHLPKDEIKVSD